MIKAYQLLIIALSINSTLQFIIATNKDFRKCYTADVSHDKVYNL